VPPLERRQIDFEAAELRLDAVTTKNGQARTFAMTAELRRVLEEQQGEAERLSGREPSRATCSRRSMAPGSARSARHERRPVWQPVSLVGRGMTAEARPCETWCA
jgi:hypothetical protein